MKKIILFILLIVVAIPGWSDEYYLVGGATQSGWERGEYERLGVRAYTLDGETWFWAGKLTVGEGDNGRFKIPNTLDGFDGFWAPTQGTVLTSEWSDLSTNNSGDNKFCVAQEGFYLVTFNTSTQKIKAEYLGELTKDGDYILISSVEDYYKFVGYIGSEATKTAKARLTADLDFAGKVFYPMGSDKFKFKGEFDGAGHTISNAIVNTHLNYIGLFTYISDGAYIHDLIINDNCSFTGGAKVGGIAGFARDGGTVTLENLVNAAEVNAVGTKDANAAGFVGCYTDGTTAKVTNCVNAGAISGYSDDQNQAGAFTGWSQAGSTYTNCLNIGEIANDGGLLRGEATLTNCHNVAASDPTVKSGELCYKMNGDQSDVNWFQNLGDGGDSHPVPFSSHAKVYANGQLKCDGTSAGGELTYSNSNTSEIPSHTYENCWCSVCGAYQEDGITATDGWYLISNAAQLRWMAESVTEHNEKYGKANIKLTADIDYRKYTDQAAMFGKPSNTYKGTFDGQNHTVTVAFVNNVSDETGLFRRINGGTVKNLKVAGTITTNKSFAAGICSGIWQTGTITNCESAVKISDEDGSGDATHGGILARVSDKNDVNVTNCLFSGELNAPNRTGCGGIIGWPDNGGTNVHVKNNLVTGTINLKDDDNNDVIVRNSADAENNYYTCELTNNLRNTKSAVEPSDEAVTSGELCYMLNAGGENWFQNLGTDPYPVPFSSHGTVYRNGSYFCDGVTPKPDADVKYANVEERYVDEHTFGENDLCSVCMAGQEPEKKDGVYQIGNCGEFVWFASHVNGGNGSAAAVLTDDINMTGVVYTPIGNTTTKYSGTFDGQYYSIRNLVIDDEDKSNVGVFGVITGGAVIKNLAVDSTCVFTANAKVGAIAGLAAGGGTFTFSNLVNAADVKAVGTVDANAAGLVGCCIDETKATVTNCINAGAISAYSDGQNQAGAFTGWSQAGSTYTNCLNIGEIDHDGGLLRGTATQTNCHNVAASDPTVASGELCYKLNAGGENWFQNLGDGGDSHPVPFSSHATVYKTSDAGWGTLYDAENALSFVGVTAYTGKIKGEWLSLTEVTEIPEGTPVVLKGTYYNKIVLAEAPAVEENDLLGAATDIVADGSQYALANKGNIGFYKVNVGQIIPAGKAYLNIGDSAVKGFVIDLDGNATGIGQVEAEDASVVIYDLSGRRVKKAQKGIYIVNGKKIAVK